MSMGQNNGSLLMNKIGNVGQGLLDYYNQNRISSDDMLQLYRQNNPDLVDQYMTNPFVTPTQKVIGEPIPSTNVPMNGLDQEDADFGMNYPMPNIQNNASQSIGLDNTIAVNEFDQEDADFGLTADIKPSEEKDKTRSFLSNISNIFDNKEAFGKIALGVALLEGTPIDEAFAMYKEFGAGDDAEVELYDNQLGRVVDVGSYDNARFRELLRTGQGRYEINPIGTYSALKSGREELIMASNIQRDADTWEKNYASAAASARSSLQDARRLQEIVDNPDFESGLLEAYSLPIRRLISDFTGEENPTVNQQLLFETIVSKLIPNVRPEGAGATSDFEINLYARAIAARDKPETVNRQLIEDMIAMNELAIKRAEYTDKALREGGSLVEADRDFSEAMDILYYDKEYSPDRLSQNQLGLLQEVYGGKIPIPKARLLSLKPYIENEVKRNSKADFVILSY